MAEKCEAAVAFYLRSFVREGKMGEDSIGKQRRFLKSYMEKNTALTGEILEYAEECSSGGDCKRLVFWRLIEDAKRGRFQTILVKDLECFGCDEAELGEYLEQIFPLLGIRVIAVASNYDSCTYVDKAMGLDAAVNQFANNFYRRDFSQKRKAVLQEKWEQGRCTRGRLPYGYVKDCAAKGGWKIDPEAADVVRLIFDRACAGWSTGTIADVLNERRILTPGQYREKKREFGGLRKVADKECLWDVGKVRTILGRYEYTGALVQHCRQTIPAGVGVTRAVPEKKQYVSEDAHEGIVSRDVFERAQAAVQVMNQPEYKMVNPYLLRGKVRCGSCNLAMSCVEQAGRSVFYCSHKLNTGKYSNCSSAGVSSEKVEATVLQAIRDKVTGKQLTREMVEEFVEMVYVYNGERIEVVVK